MDVPEYLLHFSRIGKITVEVRRENGQNLPVRKMAMESHEIEKIIDPQSGVFLTKMTFDEHSFEISKYEIRPAESQLIIWVKEIEGETH